MRLRFTFCVLVLASFALSSAFAKEPKAYQSGKLLQMDSVKCGTSEKDASSLAGEVIGTDSHNRKTQEVLCQEYTLQAEKVTYHIRPRDEKHPALLPVGEMAQFRMEKDKMYLRLQSDDSKERDYLVVSMTPRTDASSADASAPSNVNHLQ